MISGTVSEVSNTLSDNEIEMFNNWNTAGVSSGPSSYPTFTINSPFMISYIDTYHWNDGKGKNLGTIALKHSDGTTYGPWVAKRPYWKQSDDNTYWVVEPHEVVKAGKYSIIDSDPQTWSYNSQSDNNGFASVIGMKVPDSSESQTSGPQHLDEQGYHAGLGADPREGFAPLTVRFVDAGSFTTDLGGVYPVEWEWDLGDGTYRYEKEFLHTYYEPGTYWPTMMVGWSDGYLMTADTVDGILVKEPVTQSTTRPTASPTKKPTYTPEPDSHIILSSYYPDLTVSELWVMPDSVEAGRIVTVTGRIINLGGQDVPQVSVKYYLSPDSKYDRDDIKIGEFSVGAPVGYETYDNQMLLIPDDTVSGSYYILIVIDPDNIIVERSESDNVEVKTLDVIGKQPAQTVTQEIEDSPIENKEVTPLITKTPEPLTSPPTAVKTQTPIITPQITSQPTIFTTVPTYQITPHVTSPTIAAIIPDTIPTGNFVISVSPVESSAYAGEGVEYSLTINADPSFQSSVLLKLEIDALLTKLDFDLGQVDPPYPKTIVRTVPIPEYLPGGITVSGHIVGESGVSRADTDVYLTILGTDVSLPDSLILSGAAAVLIAAGSLLGLSAASLSSSLAGLQTIPISTKPDSSSTQKRSLYAGRVTGVIWMKERNYVWTGVPDSKEGNSEDIRTKMKPDSRTCSCGHQHSEGAIFCGFCGKKVSKESPVLFRTCPGCGNQVSSKASFCGKCGEKL